jgi:large subunit ribosomal protein L25
MQRKTLTAFERTEFRKSATKKLRKAGRIPAVIYGSELPASIAIDAHEFHKKFHAISENTIITIKSDSSSWDVLVKDFQEDLLNDEILHIDFYEIEQGRVLKTHVPVHTSGTPQGVKEGGILEQRLHSLEIECLPADLPEALDLDVSDLAIGDSIHVSDITPPKGVKFLNMPEQVIIVITTPKMEVIEEEEVEEELLEGEEGEEIEEAAEGEEASEESEETE